MKPMSETPPWKYHLFWYLAYSYYQNEHFFNSFVAKLKGLLSGLEDQFYRKKWEHIEIRKPIFIIGPYRSGTTILQQVLSQHSAVATPRLYSDVLDLSPILASKYMRFLIRGKDYRKIDRIIVGVDSPQEGHGLITRYFDKDRVLYNRMNSNDIRNYMRKLLYLENKTRFLWKEPYLTVKIPDLVGLFPDARFIYLHRDPIECVNSKLKFIKVWQEVAQSPSQLYGRLVGKSKRLGQLGAGYFMKQATETVNLQCNSSDPLAMASDHLEWIEKALTDMNNLASSDARCFLDYQSFVKDPHVSLRRLFEFLELPDESEPIIHELEELGMPLTLPEAKLNHIPKENIPAIKEMCEERTKRCLSGLDWKNWQVIGQIPSV
jgi:hypothetical protein